MKNYLNYLALILTVLNLSTAQNEQKFVGYRLVRLTPNTLEHIQMLETFENIPGFDIWYDVRGLGDPVDVSLSPELFDVYSRLFARENLPFTVVHENIQDIFDQERRSMSRNRASIVGRYARYSEIINYIESVVEENPDIASTYEVGRSHENRVLKAIRLKTATSQRAVWIDGGIHAREWIAVSTNIWVIDQLIKGYRNKDPLVEELLGYYEFHILPIVNPDGYEYTHTTSRLWRKNRAPNQGLCVGTDLNRNFGYQWNVAGSSTNPCSDIYSGSGPSSERETKALQSGISALAGKLDVYVNIHTYGKIWMPIWSYTTTLPDDYAEYLRVSQIAVDAIERVYGTKFIIGSPANIFSPTGGGTIDWVHEIGGVKYCFGLELRPGQTGEDSQFGFALPEDQVPLAGQETYEGLMAMIAAVKNGVKKL